MGEEAIRVVARVRPRLVTEADRGETVVTTPSATDVHVAQGEGAGRVRCYSYDAVVGPDCSNADVYTAACAGVVSGVLEGVNGAVLTYGQTASGKTHTMSGTAEDEGIVPRAVRELFEAASRRAHAGLMRKSTQETFELELACVQVFDEGVECLLTGERSIDGVANVSVPNWARASALLQEAEKRRVVARTDMNEASSRSHTIYHLQLTSTNHSVGRVRKSELFMVDLAGSESIDKTGSAGTTLRQARYINKSLLALRRVVTALVENRPHIPYRESTLTLALSRAVGGNSRTCIVVCASPTEYNRRETTAALEFGIYSNTVRNYAEVKETASVAVLERKLHSLRADLSDLQGLRAKAHGLAQNAAEAATAVETPRQGSAAWAARDYPDEFVCPLTERLMRDPWLLADGFSYEKAAALEYLRAHGRPPGEELPGVPPAYRAVAIPNNALREQIDAVASAVQTP